MLNFIVCSGSYDLNVCGATRSIDTMLVKHLVKCQADVIWVGRGVVDSPPCKYFNLGSSKWGEFIVRGIRKIIRSI